MMLPGGITLALAMYWLAGVVGAASLPPDDQYSPQPSPYRRDFAHGPRGYPNWLQYRQDSNTEFDPPETEPGVTTLKASDLSWESKVRQDTLLRDPDLSALSPRRWNVATTGVNDNFTERARSNTDVPEDSDVSSASREDPFTADDTFQDQGPGSVEVYKLDLLRENSLLVPEAPKKQRQPATKSKVPKKAPAEEILWKLKPIEPSKASFPAIFRQPPRLVNRKDEVFAVGGVPELQVGCEGLEAFDRRRRSSGPGEEASDEDSGNWQKFKIPVYKESTEPILSRVTPIVLDFEEEPPSGEVYEEMDELLKLKNLESTSPAPTTRRRNRADIDPALAIHHNDDRANVETFPERGDLGPVSIGSSKVKRSISPENSQDSPAVGAMYQMENDVRDDDTSSAIVESPSESSRHHGGRKLLWIQHPERPEVDNQARSRNRRADNDLWGFGEDDGAISGSDDESEAEQLRRVEMEKRRREYERRRQEELARRRGGHSHRPHSQEQRNNDANSEAERIREEYERQVEKEQRGRQRIENERRGQGDRRYWEEERRRTEEANRRREEESRRRMEAEDERNRRNRPSSLTHPEQPHHVDNSSRSRQEDREAEERKLREYIARNRPIDPKTQEDRRRLEGESRWRNDDEERRRHMDEERRRQQMEEHRRRQQQLEEDERRRQMEEHRRRQQQPDEEERRRQMEEHRRRQQQPDEEERRRHMEEHRRRQQQPDEEERRRQMEEHRRRQQEPYEEERRRQMEEHRRRQQQSDEEERRRQMEEQRRRQQQPDDEERRRQIEEQRRRQQHADEYEKRRQMEELRRRHQSDEEERRRQMEEQRRRSRPDNRTVEDERRRRLEEERKLQDYVRRNQPVNVPRRNNSEGFASRERDLDEQRRTLEAARQYERNRVESSRMNGGRSHGPSAPTNIGHRQSHSDLEEIRRRQEADSERRRLEDEERRREEEYRRTESRRREEERLRLEAMRRREENRRSQSESGKPSWHDTGSSRRPANTPHRGDSASEEVRNREAEELRRQEAAERTSMRNPENEWRRRSDERERVRMENERNSRNNGRRRPQHGDTGFKEHRQRGGTVGNSDERRRREHARLRSLPVSARIVVRTNDASRPTGASRVEVPPTTSIDTRANFDNDIGFPPLNPNRQGVSAGRFPVPATQRPPVKSPGACVWAIVQCCPANNRLTTCFESMGCPGSHWDPNPCRGSLADAARDEVVRFYKAVEEDRRRI